MERFERILVYAVPASTITPTLLYATRVARHSQGVVTVVDCLHGDTTPEHLEINRDCPQCVQLEREQRELGSVARQETRSRLESVCRTLRDQGVSATAKVLVGQPAVEIIREVLRGGHDVVMKTAQGKGANKERAFFGTTAIELMRRCPCPVWVVDPDETSRFERVLAAVDLLNDDLDHMNLNDDLVHLAADLAESENGVVHVAHACTPYGVTVLISRTPEESLKRCIEVGRQHTQHRMSDLLTRCKRSVSPHNVHFLYGAPERAIPDFAQGRRIDLIVMGTVGRTGLSGFVVGNTAEKVLRHVRCSVLVLKPGVVVPPVQLGDSEGLCVSRLKS